MVRARLPERLCLPFCRDRLSIRLICFSLHPANDHGEARYALRKHVFVFPLAKRQCLTLTSPRGSYRKAYSDVVPKSRARIFGVAGNLVCQLRTHSSRTATLTSKISPWLQNVSVSRPYDLDLERIHVLYSLVLPPRFPRPLRVARALHL
jgi:hypothetical protein